jgi:hypothetical protein
VLDEFPEVRRLIDTVTDAFSDIQEVGIELRRTDGLWYVSPVATGTEGLLAVLRALDRSELDAIIEQAPAAGEEFFDAILGGFAEMPGSFDVDDLASDDVAEVAEPPLSIDDDDLTELVVEDASSGDWEDCYAEQDPAVATDCFRAAVDRGDIDSSFVPVTLRFPECGYAAGWGGALFGLPDDEFIAAAESARPCFLDLVERGEVSEYELPTEILHLDCFEGRNWYNVFDDPEYDDRYYACLEAGG